MLDYLAELPELMEWYSDTYPYTFNPLGMHTKLDVRPETPVATTRRVLVGGEEVDQEVDSLVQQHEAQAKVLKAWGVALNDSPAWWPVSDMVGHDGYAEDEAVMAKAKVLAGCRRASKLLLAERRREQDKQDKFASLSSTLKSLSGRRK